MIRRVPHAVPSAEIKDAPFESAPFLRVRQALGVSLAAGMLSCAHQGQVEESVIAPYKSTEACPETEIRCRKEMNPVHTAPPPAYGNRVVRNTAPETETAL